MSAYRSGMSLVVSLVAAMVVSSCGGSSGSSPAIQACFDRYRFNPNATDPHQWENEHDINGGRMRRAMRTDGSPVLYRGQQVYSVAIPKKGEIVHYNALGLADGDTAGCQMYQDADSGEWRSAYGF